MNQIVTIEQINMCQKFDAILNFSLLSRVKWFEVLLMDHNSKPVIHRTNKQHKNGLLVLNVLKFDDLLVKVNYLVWCTMDKAERILYHTELHWYVTIAVN